jgi:hypothetical protein
MNREMDLGHFCYLQLLHVTNTTWGLASQMCVRVSEKGEGEGGVT